MQILNFIKVISLLNVATEQIRTCNCRTIVEYSKQILNFITAHSKPQAEGLAVTA